MVVVSVLHMHHGGAGSCNLHTGHKVRGCGLTNHDHRNSAAIHTNVLLTLWCVHVAHWRHKKARIRLCLLGLPVVIIDSATLLLKCLALCLLVGVEAEFLLLCISIRCHWCIRLLD